MRLVPRQLRRSDFPSSVPYYGGRLTPQVIQGMKTYGERGHPPTATAPAPPDPAVHQLALLEDLRANGYVTPSEYEEIRRRIVGEG